MERKILTTNEVLKIQPLVLAMIGDSIQTLFVREFVAREYGFKVNKMSKVVSSVVQAGSQFKTFKKIEDSLSEEEKGVAMRGRNAHIHTKAKNFSYTEYIYATALETLIGHLYLSGQDDRLSEILNKSLEEIDLNK